MADDLNSVIIVGRLTRTAELSYTRNNSPFLRFSIAVNRRRLDGEVWRDEANFFDLIYWGGRRAESLSRFLQKGQQIAVNGRLKQDRWEQDGQRRSKIVIEVNDIQLLGGRNDNLAAQGNDGAYADSQMVSRYGDNQPPRQQEAHSAMPSSGSNDTATPATGNDSVASDNSATHEHDVREFDDDIPF